MIWIFDVETFKNLFVATFKNPKTQEVKIFCISEQVNQVEELVKFISTNSSSWFIGYNSFNYDNQILNYIYKNSFEFCLMDYKDLTIKINDLSNDIVFNKFSEYKYNLPFRHLDLMIIGRYKKSLKLLGVSLRWHKLQEMPIDSKECVPKEQIESIINYNLNDVLITEKLYEHLKNSIKFRHELSSIYELDLYNCSDTQIADILLAKFYSESTGLKYNEFKDLRTERKYIKFNWAIFDDVTFETEELIKLLENIKEHTYYQNKPHFKRKITIDNVKYVIGLGGLHSEDEPGLFEETQEHLIIDADISSMYPATLINKQLYPEHLGNKFLKRFKQIRDDRLHEKEKGNKVKSEGLKLIMNAAIGKTKNKYSFLYDVLVNIQITINGQLYVLMLIEKLTHNGIKVISANTDGIISLVPRNKYELYKKLCSEWEQRTGYSLEYNSYKKYIRKDVNNYLAIKQDNTIKEKGIFSVTEITNFNNSTDPLNKGWDKPIVSKALYNYFIHNIPISSTIYNCKDIYDFCIAKRIDEKFVNEFHIIKDGEYKKEDLQRSVRYYVSNTGGTLLKSCKEENKTSNYEVNKTVTIFNDYIHYDDFKQYNIDYSYYINSAQKIIDQIINPQLTLF